MSGSLVGQTLLGRYSVVNFIATGGMGVVYRVKDKKRNVFLALKTLHADLADDPSIFRRFKREAQSLENLDHPSIVRFYGLYQSEELVFILEDFVLGAGLDEILAHSPGKPLSLKNSLVVLKTLCNALGYAHLKTIVHCDVKPGNLLIDINGCVLLTDFGIARHSDSTTTTLADAGSPAYITPEQVRGKPVSPATDIYALAVLMYELITGRRPFLGNEPGTGKENDPTGERLRKAHRDLIPPDPCQFNSRLPSGFSKVLLKALEKNPKDRYQTTAQFFSAFCASLKLDEKSIPDDFVLPAWLMGSLSEKMAKMQLEEQKEQKQIGNKVTLGEKKSLVESQLNPRPPPPGPTPVSPHLPHKPINPVHIALAGLFAAFLGFAIFGKSCSQPPQKDFRPALTASAVALNPQSTNIPKVAGTATLRPRPTNTPRAFCWGEGKDNGINIRRSPGGDIIKCCIGKGEDLRVTMIDGSGKWALVEGIDRPDHQGWAALSYIKLAGDCSTVLAGQ